MSLFCALADLAFLLLGLNISLGNSAVSRWLGMPMIPPWIGWLLVTVPGLTLAAAAAFVVRGYVLSDDFLSIKRLGWKNRMELSRLNSATVDPDAFRWSLRRFGNGGFFSFTGLYRNKKIGLYRAFATDTKNAVVLRFSDKTVVITPDDPQKFVTEINSNLRTPA